MTRSRRGVCWISLPDVPSGSDNDLMLHRRLKDEARPPAVATTFTWPSHEDLRIRSAILAYVVGESYHDLTILELAIELSPTNDSDAVERAVRDLVGEELLDIDGGKVVPNETWTTDLPS